MGIIHSRVPLGVFPIPIMIIIPMKLVQRLSPIADKLMVVSISGYLKHHVYEFWSMDITVTMSSAFLTYLTSLCWYRRFRYFQHESWTHWNRWTHAILRLDVPRGTNFIAIHLRSGPRSSAGGRCRCSPLVLLEEKKCSMLFVRLRSFFELNRCFSFIPVDFFVRTKLVITLICHVHDMCQSLSY